MQRHQHLQVAATTEHVERSVSGIITRSPLKPISVIPLSAPFPLRYLPLRAPLPLSRILSRPLTVSLPLPLPLPLRFPFHSRSGHVLWLETARRRRDAIDLAVCGRRVTSLYERGTWPTGARSSIDNRSLSDDAASLFKLIRVGISTVGRPTTITTTLDG